MSNELKDVKVAISGNDAISFNTPFGWVTNIEFNLCGDLGIDKVLERLAQIKADIRPVPHQNLSCFESAWMYVDDKFNGTVDSAIADFKESGVDVEKTLSMTSNGKEVVVFSIKLSLTDPQFNSDAMND